MPSSSGTPPAGRRSHSARCDRCARARGRPTPGYSNAATPRGSDAGELRASPRRRRTRRARACRSCRALSTRADDRLGDLLRPGDDRRHEEHDHGVDARVGEHVREHRLVGRAGRRAEHVDRVREARLARQERRPARRASPRDERRQLEAGRLAGVGAEDPEPAGVREQRHPAARAAAAGDESRTATSTSSSSVSARITPAWLEERLDRRRPSRRARPCASRRRAAPAVVRPPFIARIGFLRATRRARRAELARVAERLEVEQDQIGRRVVLPVLEQVVRGDVGLVADRDEGREAEPARGRLLEQREPERAALRGEADVAGGEGVRARRSRSAPGRRTKMPRQFGPISRAPCARTRASSCSWRRMPSMPGLGEAGGDHAERARPLPQRRLGLVEHRARRERRRRPGRRVGDVGDRRVGAHAGDRRAPSG